MVRIAVMSENLSHINEKGEAHMVDVSSRDESIRIAVASGKVKLRPEVLNLIAQGQAPKGDVLATARVAGILGAKKTSELIPLCHPIAIHSVVIDLTIESGYIAITSTVKTADRTGVEMEALTAVTVTALTLIDMVKALDPYAEIKEVQMISKSGGRNGEWKR